MSPRKPGSGPNKTVCKDARPTDIVIPYVVIYPAFKLIRNAAFRIIGDTGAGKSTVSK